jgi:hypothetical protein
MKWLNVQKTSDLNNSNLEARTLMRQSFSPYLFDALSSQTSWNLIIFFYLSQVNHNKGLQKPGFAEPKPILAVIFHRFWIRYQRQLFFWQWAMTMPMRMWPCAVGCPLPLIAPLVSLYSLAICLVSLESHWKDNSNCIKIIKCACAGSNMSQSVCFQQILRIVPAQQS